LRIRNCKLGIEESIYSDESEQEFKRKIEAGEFLEWTKKFGYLYGTATETIQDSLTRGADLLLDIDTEGARNLKKVLPDAVFVFILPPSLEELRRRLENRGSECEDSIGIRLNKAGEEIKEVFWYDYIIINEKIGEGVEQLKSIYLAEKNKRNRKISEVKKRFNLEEKINYGKNNC